MSKTTGISVVLAAFVAFLYADIGEADQTLSPISQGKYFYYNGSGWSELGSIDVGQSQAGWASFDVSGVTPSLVCGLTYTFNQNLAVNPGYFPIVIGIYDVDTAFADLNVARNPLDSPVGTGILLDLHTGTEYGAVSVSASYPQEYNVILSQEAIEDLIFEIGSVDQVFSIGMANSTGFDDTGYFQAYSVSLTVAECPPPPGLTVDCEVYPVTAGVPTEVIINGSGFDDEEGMVSDVAVKRGGPPGTAVIDSIDSNFQVTTTVTAKDGGKLPRTQTLVVTKDNKESVKCVGSVVVSQ